MEKNDNYFNNQKSEAERLRNVATLVNSIVNTKHNKDLEVEAGVGEGDGTVEELPKVDPLVDLVGKAISTHKPRGMFMHGVQTDDHPKL